MLLAINLSGCWLTVAPAPIKDLVHSHDSSTPAQYKEITTVVVQKQKEPVKVVEGNSGFLGFNDAGNGLITANARDKYNNLIELYAIKYKTDHAKVLVKDSGITPFIDKYGNQIYIIDKEHLVAFTTMNRWRKAQVPPDSFFSKLVN